MKATFTLKDLTEKFYADLAAMPSDGARFDFLNRDCRDLKVSMRVDDGSLGANVAFNQVIRIQRSTTGNAQPKSYKLELRKGYRLATFVF